MTAFAAAVVVAAALHYEVKVSEGARQKIEAAGGTVTLIEAENQPKRSKIRTDKGLKSNRE